MGNRTKPRKALNRISHAKHRLNPDRSNKGGKGSGQLRSSSTVRRLLMYKNFKANYDRRGKMVRPAPFQGTLKSGTVARVEPNRRWFGNTRVIGQEALQKFQENLGKAIADPYLCVLKQTKLPVTLLMQKRKKPRSHRKKPKVATDDLQEMVNEAASRSERYDEVEDSYLKREADSEHCEFQDPLFRKGQSKRIWNELYKVLDSSDFVLKVLDARDPMGTGCFNVEKFLKKEKAFQAELKSPLGKGALINVLRQLAKLNSERQQISVGLIGFPNVGKSSIINALRSKVCNVAPIAGETKVWQYVTLMRQVYLIDFLGIVYPTGNSEEQLILKGVVRVENVKEPSEYIDHVVQRVRKEYLVRTYQVDNWNTASEFLVALCNRNGRLPKGGEPDVSASARMVLNDFQRGKLPYYVPPPELKEENVAEDRSNRNDTVINVRVHQGIAQVVTSMEFVDEDKLCDLNEEEVDVSDDADLPKGEHELPQKTYLCKCASAKDRSRPPINVKRKKARKQIGIVDFTQEPDSRFSNRRKRRRKKPKHQM
uniref:Nucleolar GTP-binding protein 2 n=1 Tax=Trichuris muris TaxID=70415 RepID=A0A5S6QIB0_TRIMR